LRISATHVRRRHCCISRGMRTRGRQGTMPGPFACRHACSQCLTGRSFSSVCRCRSAGWLPIGVEGRGRGARPATCDARRERAATPSGSSFGARAIRRSCGFAERRTGYRLRRLRRRDCRDQAVTPPVSRASRRGGDGWLAIDRASFVRADSVRYSPTVSRLDLLRYA
jgi:hypothetical protein